MPEYSRTVFLKPQVGEVRQMSEIPDQTMLFHVDRDLSQVRAILKHVYEALKEKGYDPIGQMVGYLLSGDPTYITSHRNARSLMRTVERDEVIEVLVQAYLRGIDTTRK
jgi:uncharacterized protein (UPF0297 family)